MCVECHSWTTTCSCGGMLLCFVQPMANGEPRAEEPQQPGGQPEGMAGMMDEDDANGTFVWGTTVSVRDVTTKFTSFVRTFTESDDDVESKYSALLNEVCSWRTLNPAGSARGLGHFLEHGHLP